MSDLELRDDGTIVAQVAGQAHTLRRPLLGEYRKLREVLHTLSNQGRDRQREALQAAAEAAQRAAEAAKADPDSPPEPLPDVGWFDPSVEVEQWVLEAFTMLGDHGTPDGAQLPGWCADAELPSTWLAHWRAVPLGPGRQ